MEDLIENLRKHLDSPEGKKSTEEYFQKIRQREEIENSQLERFHERFGENVNSIITKVIAKYSSKEYVRKEYKLGFQPRTPFYFFLYEYAVKYGTYTDEVQYQTSFSDGAYIIGDYVFALLIGQGSAINVYDRVMKFKKKIYIPIEGKQLTENGFVLIATGSSNITDEGVKFDFCQKHLREIETNVLSDIDLKKIISDAMDTMSIFKNQNYNKEELDFAKENYINQILK